MPVLAVDKSRELARAATWADDYRAVLCQVAEAFLGGNWPTLDSLGRAALRRGDEIDVYAALRALPTPLGHLSSDEHVVLRVRGLALCPRAEPVLNGFVRVMQLAVARLISHDSEPKLLNADLMETLGMNEHLARTVGRLIISEGWMLGGGSGDVETGWMRDITEHTRFMRGVTSLDEYLRVECEYFWSGTSYVAVDQHSPPSAVATHQPPTSSQSSAVVIDLHPRVAAASQELLAGGHYDAAVHHAALALQELLQERSGLTTLEGYDLAGAAFGGDKPPIQVVGNVSTKRGMSEQKGWLQLAQGVFSALRNPVAHRAVRHDRDEAIERLVTIGLIARMVDASTL